MSVRQAEKSETRSSSPTRRYLMPPHRVRANRFERGMSALPSKADILSAEVDVRYVPCVDGSLLARVF